MQVDSAGGERSAVVVVVVVAVVVDAAADVVAELLGRLERTVWQRWLEIDFDVVVVAVVEWVEGCEGRDGGVVGQREAGRTGFVVVRDT